MSLAKEQATSLRAFLGDPEKIHSLAFWLLTSQNVEAARVRRALLPVGSSVDPKKRFQTIYRYLFDPTDEQTVANLILAYLQSTSP